jgi:hypothetical protein
MIIKKAMPVAALLFFLLSARAADADRAIVKGRQHQHLNKPSDPVKPINVYVNRSDEKQTMHSFGASDCWTAKFIGNWKNVQAKEQVADYLFSLDTLADGSPKGIGLSLWRFNIGAGSYEQDTASHIADVWRREECFMNSKGEYDWTKQQGGQWFLNAAKKRGVKYTLGFSIAPPVSLSKNGFAYNSDTAAATMNIQKDKMPAYADFMAKVSAHFKFDYLSPVNETQWTWGNSRGWSQEGTQATNEEIATLVRSLSEKMKNDKTMIVVPESGRWDFLYGRNGDGRGDQIYQFFSAASKNYIGNLPKVVHAISSHSYDTTCPEDTMANIRNRVANRIREVDPRLQTWETEFGVLRNICNQYHGYPRSTGIEYGIYVANVIHHDITVANVSSWQWWLAMSPYDYSDALVYVSDKNGKIDIKNCMTDGVVYDSKQLWALGNYSRFVRPGMKRIGVNTDVESPAVAASSLVISAYKDDKTKQMVVVVINPGNQAKRICLNDVKNKRGFKKVDVYTTDASSSLRKSAAAPADIEIGGKSIVTIVGKYEK